MAHWSAMEGGLCLGAEPASQEELHAHGQVAPRSQEGRHADGEGSHCSGPEVLHRVALDHGSQELAITLLPYEDTAIGIQDRNAPPTAAQDPFSGLADAEESPITLQYLADMVALNKAKQERLKGGGKGKGKDKDKGGGEDAGGRQGNGRQPKK